MYVRCDKCVTDKSKCKKCNENPIYKDFPSYSQFSEYIPVCPKGMTDCISDPAYILCHYPEWYKELYGDKTPEEAIKTEEDCREENCHYDDEDK